MSFLSQHIARETSTPDPVTGKQPAPAPNLAPTHKLRSEGGKVLHDPATPYEHQDYPRVVHHPEHGSKQVNSAEEHKALGDGWQTTPIETKETSEA